MENTAEMNMKNASDNTSIISEADSVEKKKIAPEDRIPAPIVLRTKIGESIVMDAISPTEYIKTYYTAEDTKKGILDNPRRTKKVSLLKNPVRVNDKFFSRTYPLFVELSKSAGYQRL